MLQFFTPTRYLARTGNKSLTPIKSHDSELTENESVLSLTHAQHKSNISIGENNELILLKLFVPKTLYATKFCN